MSATVPRRKPTRSNGRSASRGSAGSRFPTSCASPRVRLRATSARSAPAWARISHRALDYRRFGHLGTRWPRLIGLICGFAIPALVVVGYIAFGISNQYTSEARLAVRGGEQVSADPISALTGLASFTQAQDTLIVVNYVRSRAIVEELDRSIGLRTDVFPRRLAFPLPLRRPDRGPRQILALEDQDQRRKRLPGSSRSRSARSRRRTPSRSPTPWCRRASNSSTRCRPARPATRWSRRRTSSPGPSGGSARSGSRCRTCATRKPRSIRAGPPRVSTS